MYVFLTAVGFLIVVPFLWMISTSLKEREVLRTLPIRWIPEHPTLNSFRRVLEVPTFHFSRAVFNSFYLSIVSTAISVLSAAMAAFIFAKVRFKGRDKLFLLFLASMMIPGSVTMIPNYIVLQKLHLLDTFTGFLLPSVISAFGIFMFRQNMMLIDDSYLEAALIEGASLARVFWTCVLPLSKATAFTLCLFGFMGTWNAYLWPLIILTDKDKWPLQVGLGTLATQYGSHENLLMAGALISILPILVVYILTQKYVERGLTVGALK